MGRHQQGTANLFSHHRVAQRARWTQAITAGNVIVPPGARSKTDARPDQLF